MAMAKRILGGALCLVPLLAGTAAAAPASSVADLRVAARASSNLQRVASGDCRWRKGKWHCVRYARARPANAPNQASDYYEHQADKLPYGSQRWWDQMLRENRAGNSPGGGGHGN